MSKGKLNPFFKAYCRVFQFFFKMAIPILPYREPKLGDSIADIGKMIKETGAVSVLLVTDKYLRENGLTSELEKHIADSGAKLFVYDGTRPNPTVGNVEEAREIYVANDCGCIVAFGGGSSIDCAKAVGARIAYPKKSVNQMGGILKVWRKLPPIVAIPTTAGTGSEVTVTAVITDDEKKHKYTMNNFTMIPSYAILDPAVTYTLPKDLTATTGMDALTHAVEAYIGNSTTKETRALALEVTKLIFGNIEKAYNNGSDVNARKNMLLAAYKAGIAFSKSYVGYIHSVAHSLGGRYNIPHGLANAVLMPIVLEDYGKAVHKKLCELGVAAGVCSEGDDPGEGAAKFIRSIYELNERMNIPTTLEGIKEEDISEMARHAAKEANPLYPVPVLMSDAELGRLYRKVGNI